MITAGRSYTPWLPQTGSSSTRSITVALSFITSTSARLNDTIASGSYPAFRTSVRIRHPLDPPGRLPGTLDSHEVAQEADRSRGRKKAPSRDSAFRARQRRGIPAGYAEGRDDRGHPWFGCSVFAPSASPTCTTTGSG